MAFTDILIIGLVLQMELQGEELYWKMTVFTKGFMEHACKNSGAFQRAYRNAKDLHVCRAADITGVCLGLDGWEEHGERLGLCVSLKWPQSSLSTMSRAGSAGNVPWLPSRANLLLRAGLRFFCCWFEVCCCPTANIKLSIFWEI